MFDGNPIIAFLLAVLLIELTPGPTSAYLVLISTTYGRGPGLLAVGGVALGLGMYLAASTVGLEALIAIWPAGLSILRWTGVAYLLVLAFDAWRGAGAPAASAAEAPRAGKILVRGMLASLLNPKTAIFYISLLPGFMRPAAGPLLLQILTLGSIHLAVATTVHIGLALAGGRAHQVLASDASRSPWLGRAAAVGLGLIAAWVALQGG